MPIKLLYGNEPYIIAQKKRELANGGEYSITDSFDVGTVRILCQNSFFGPVRVLWRADTEKDLNSLFFDYVDSPSEDSLLVVYVRTVDERKKEFLKLKSCKNIEFIPCNKYEDRMLKRHLFAQFYSAGMTISDETLDLLAKRLGYKDDPTVSFYTCMEVAEELIADASGKEINSDLVSERVPMRDEISQFKLAPYIERKDLKTLLSQANSITNSNGAIPFLMLIYRELRVAYKSRFCNLSEIGAFGVNFKQKNLSWLVAALEQVGRIIQAVKLSELPESIAVAYCFWKLTKLEVSG